MTVTRCLLCASCQTKPLDQYQEDYLVQCGRCGFVFSWKIPSEEELIRHYNTYDRHQAHSPVTTKRYHALLDGFERYRQTNNLLDVGCGGGHFLVEAKKRGWNVYGTEYTSEAVTLCTRQGIRMSQGKLDSGRYGRNERFDVITSFEVIEHISNPREEVAHCHDLLRKGGIVYVTTPNFGSISRSLARGKWNVLDYPEHLCYYTRPTLRGLFEGCGLKRIHSATTGISFDRLKRNVGEIRFSDQKNNDEQIRRLTEEKWLFRWTKKIVNAGLTLTSKGDTLKAVFQKV